MNLGIDRIIHHHLHGTIAGDVLTHMQKAYLSIVHGNLKQEALTLLSRGVSTLTQFNNFTPILQIADLSIQIHDLTDEVFMWF